MTEPIPGPKTLPFVGNLLDLMDDEAPLRALEHLAEVYGPVYKLSRQGNKVIIVSSVEVMEEICDESRYVKAPPRALSKKTSKASGLFTATSNDPDWGQAHRILMPAFGPLAIEGQFDREFSIVGVCIRHWLILVSIRDARYRKSTSSKMGANGSRESHIRDRRLHATNARYHCSLRHGFPLQLLLPR